MRIIATVLSIAIIFSLTGCGNEGSPTSSDHEYEATASFEFANPVTSQTKQSIANIAGSVQVVGVIGLDTVYITGTKRVVSYVSQSDAEDHLSDIQIVTHDQTVRYSVETSQPNSNGQRQYSVDYVVRMPATMALELVQTAGTVDIEGIYGNVVLANVTGGVNLDNLRGNVTATVVTGDLNVDCVVPQGGALTLSSVTGSINLVIPAATSAGFAATVVTGAIALHDLTLNNADISELSVSGVLGLGQGSISLATTTGSIVVTGI